MKLTKRRINMLATKSTANKLYKPLLFVPVLLFLGFTFSCRQEYIEPANPSHLKLSANVIPDLFARQISQLQHQEPDRNYHFKYVADLELEEMKASDHAVYQIDFSAEVTPIAKFRSRRQY